MAKKENFDAIEIEGELLNTVSYATYYCRLPLFTSFKIFNREADGISALTVSVSGDTALILRQEIAIEELPANSSIEVVPQNILNPKYLADLESPEVCKVQVKLTKGKTVICTLEADVQTLPLDCWSGLSGNLETLADFVRPKMADCQKILAEAGLQLRTWGYSSEFSGYAGNDRNAVRNAVAAIYACVHRQNVERENMPDCSGIVSTGDISRIIENKKATPLQMALFAASCLEASKLNPVLVVGRQKIGVGVWLYESCFSSSFVDDMQLVDKYITDGVNNLAIFDADDLFAHRNASYTTSEAHFSAQLRRDEYEMLVDVKRCRIGGFYPLPLKVKTASGYELLGSKQFSYDEKPQDVIDASRYDYERTVSKDLSWQRRLLDLSMKNNLLNFRYRRDCLHMMCGDLNGFCARLAEGEKFSLISNNIAVADAMYFGESKGVMSMGELIDIEMRGGKIRALASENTLIDTVGTLIRKARAAAEETGSNSLYLAFGFLSWKQKGEKEDKFAPIALMPVTLSRTKTQGVALTVGDEYVVNSTLIEFLKQEFGIDVRGLDGKNLTPREMIAVFRAKTANMKGWNVYEDVYLAHFTFTRYAMWADVRNNIKEYGKNPLIKSLLTNMNKLDGNKLAGADEDDGNPCETLMPLACDSAQYEAVTESAKGTTFVLHGPPGTGKSQTITNMIANALAGGKRVLFVAEKQAALQVVKKRLTEIGLGDFCLELHSGKSADKAEIVRSIENTLALKTDYDNGRFFAAGDEIVRTRETLKKPLAALHKKRRLGVSIYEAIVYYLQNKNAPELVNVESTFYDSLTKAKFAECENMLTTTQAAANECGGVYRSPFSEVRLTECDKAVKAAAQCSAEVVLIELKHLKSYLGLFLETFNQKISKFTHKKLENLLEIAGILKGDTLNVFFACDEEQFYKFFNANLRYDSEVKHWLKHFKALPDLSGLADSVEQEMAKWGDNYRSSRLILNVLKRINRCAREPLQARDEPEWIKRACEIEQARARMFGNTPLSQNFVSFGGINDKRREAFLAPLYNLHKLCAETFMDYNADAFNSVCVQTAGGILKPMISGLILAITSFTKAVDFYLKTIKADKNSYYDQDLFECYSSKCSAIVDNIDLLPAWCMYRATAKKLNEAGLTFMTDAMESGRISGAQILSSFRKNVYRNFIQTNIPADEDLAAFSASVLDENAAAFSMLLEEFTALTREKIRADLIARLPDKETEGSLALELMAFQRQIKGNLKGLNLRSLFSEIPQLMKVVAPCMLMSPITVSQYLPAESGLFDMVIFDEASQIPTCEAVPSLARSKSAVIVGDPKQMPPTSFFTGGGEDEDHPEAEDMESLLEDCLALGIPQKHLIWHYRSKHESLIAFSNIMYYSSKLCTFPSPDALDSKVTLRYIQSGVYDRGLTKCNKQEADEIVEEVVRRLKSGSKSSIGIVTFSTPQQVYVEKLISKRLAAEGLEEAAFEREEPLFVKNLENVQGDERDVILFSVCYGPDKMGRISLNFGPLNQFGGWRRLNVAVSRAREEMVVFSSMRYSMIDLSRTNARGVAGLKSFLEFAEKGRANISIKNDEVILNRQGIGKFVAEELSNYGYECRCDLGVSDFKIDVAVVDPANKHNFILAVLCDGTTQFSVKDRSVMQVQTLKRNNWNVIRLYAINFFNNPKREIKKIKDYLDKLTGGGSGAAVSANFAKNYRLAKSEIKQVEPAYILSGENDAEVIRVIKAVLTAEEPISRQFLIKRTLSFFGISKSGVKLDAKIGGLIDGCAFRSAEMLGNVYYYKTDKCFAFDKYRAEDGGLRLSDSDYTPFDIISLVKAILLSKVSVYADELVTSVLKILKVPRSTEKLVSFVAACIDEGVKRGIFIRSLSDKISLS